jgi:hypothetical protein
MEVTRMISDFRDQWFPSNQSCNLWQEFAMQKILTSRGEVLIGTPEEVESHSLQGWRDRTIQERLDIFVELMRIWHPDATGIARIAHIARVPESPSLPG